MSRHVAPVRADALERAFRTLWQGFLVDAAAAIGIGLASLLVTGDLTSPGFWTAVGLLIAKSLLTSLASYLTRLTSTPKNGAL